MKKLERFLFYIFIFLIPLQARITLFSSGERFIEWNSAFLYLTDLLLIGVFILWALRKFDPLASTKLWRVSNVLLLGFFIIAGLSLLVSQSINISIYQLIKLAEFILLFVYIKYNLFSVRSPLGDLRIKLKDILKIFIASGLLQSLLAIAQFFKQSSLGLKYIEAGVFKASIPGVATFLAPGEKFIRSYGTFPHPNVLAVFLIFAIFALYQLWGSEHLTSLKKIAYSIALFVLTTALWLTFSRAVLLVYWLTSLIFLIVASIKFTKFRKVILSLALLVVLINLVLVLMLAPEMKARFSALSVADQAIGLRLYYNQIGLSLIKESPLFGVGLGGFVPYLLSNYQLKEAWLYQPIHNIYLLLASEMGLLALLVFMFFIITIIWQTRFWRELNYTKLLFLGLAASFLALGLIDHYFWTIQQGRIVFWLLLAIIGGLSYLSGSSNRSDLKIG